MRWTLRLGALARLEEWEGEVGGDGREKTYCAVCLLVLWMGLDWFCLRWVVLLVLSFCLGLGRGRGRGGRRHTVDLACVVV